MAQCSSSFWLDLLLGISSSGRSPNRAEVREALRELERFSEFLSIPDKVRDEAAQICARSVEMGLAKRGSLPRVAVASLYAACREREFPATLDDMAETSGVDRKGIARCYRMLVRDLSVRVPVADPAEYVAMLASRARASAVVQASALYILSRAEKAGTAAGSNPIGLAAAALYIAAATEGERLTQRNAAEAAGVGEVTLREEYKRLRKAL